ncbi:DUF3124 domain-containing protein [Neolewinella aurantiaca]|uniref:DUF3124 domain-containing protein n=1 Tax=Neolewinella aurantiaca TaxID=2602767 RepID=A0A5C7FQ88_9BACT|nr:DUF3124 domain-containing protein [Neolewinella aurantiaca]TXF88160.1 DUF3124 domain-containing protein [Neolewinella aurantiaca]
MRDFSFTGPIMLLLALLVVSCDPSPPAREITSIPAEDWTRRQAEVFATDSMETGSTYLSSYSEIYTKSETHTFSLTGTISLRNINLKDTVYIEGADYHKTDGEQIRSYFDTPIYLAPLETVSIIITEGDLEGGTGDNFVFRWRKPVGSHDPFFEGIFISVYGQQGISFTTRGIRIN